MSYQIVSLGNLSGGLNETDPASKIGQNECSRLFNMEYRDGNDYPETRRGSAYLATFNEQIYGAFTLNLNGSNSNVIVITTDGATGTEFWGKGTADASYTTRGIEAAESWLLPIAVTMNDLLVMAAPGTGYTPKKWTGTGNVADLTGTPPTGIIAMATWNNRLFAVTGAEPYTVEYCQLGDVEDWTDVNAVSGAGFFEMVTGGDQIIALIAHKERLIIFRQNSIWQVIAALPNTDPGGWRLELVTDRGGCKHKYCVKPMLNDLIFHSPGYGWCSFSAVQQFGDFESAVISRNVDASVFDLTNTPAFAATAENKCLMFPATDPQYNDSEGYIWAMEAQPNKGVRWARWGILTVAAGGASVTRVPKFVSDEFYVSGIRKILIAHNEVGAAGYQLAYWPNDETDDDKYRDHVGGPDGALKFLTATRSRAWDGGNLQEVKQIQDAGFSIARKSAGTGFTAAGELSLNIYIDENAVTGSAKDTYSFTDGGATITSPAHHTKRVRVTGSLGRRFHSIQLEIATNKSGLGILVKDMDIKVTQATRAFHDTLSQV